MNSETDMNMKRIKCREKVRFNTLTQLSIYLAGTSCSLPVLGITTILTLLPALIYGCSVPEDPSSQNEASTALRLMNASNSLLTEAESIDVLVFNDDKMRSLDTYQRFGMTSCSTVKAASASGDKIMSIAVNSGIDRYGWKGICSYDGLAEIHSHLEKECKERPVMSGECRTKAGSHANIRVTRLSSEIVLRSLSCDFRGKPYSGELLRDVKVYLTNVNAEVPIFHDSRFMPTRIINSGRLNMSDIEQFSEPETVMQEIPYPIGESVTRPDICLRCYPNEAEEETSGTPFTRLVIEGSLEGTTYYWPVSINRNDGGGGIGRNCRYIYDIRIKRKGNTDPDIPVETEEGNIIMSIEPWEEKEDYGVRF